MAELYPEGVSADAIADYLGRSLKEGQDILQSVSEDMLDEYGAQILPRHAFQRSSRPRPVLWPAERARPHPPLTFPEAALLLRLWEIATGASPLSAKAPARPKLSAPDFKIDGFLSDWAGRAQISPKTALKHFRALVSTKEAVRKDGRQEITLLRSAAAININTREKALAIFENRSGKIMPDGAIKGGTQ